MKNGCHLNFVGRNFIKDRERKTAYNCTSERSINNRIRERIMNDACKRLIDPSHEIDIEEFLLGGRTIGELRQVHFRRRE